MGSEVSGARKIAAGCPQGSVLGPLLALMYLNDIKAVTSSPMLLFADDTAIFLSHEQNSPEAASQLQIDVDKIVQFGKKWGITFNALRTVQQTSSHKQGWRIRGFEGARAPPRRQKNPLEIKEKPYKTLRNTKIQQKYDYLSSNQICCAVLWRGTL